MKLRPVSLVAVLALFAGSASAQPADRGLDGGPPTYKAATDGFLGARPLLKDLSTADQALLAKLINTYTSANGNAVVKVHM